MLSPRLALELVGAGVSLALCGALWLAAGKADRLTLEIATLQAAGRQQAAQATQKEQEARHANDQIIAGLHAQLAGSAGLAADLSRRLYNAAHHSCPVPETDSQSGTAPAAPEPGGAGEIEQAVAGVIQACQSDAANLSALQAVVRGQM